VGKTLIDVLTVLGSRGGDGVGVSLYGALSPSRWVARVLLAGPAAPADQAEDVLARVGEIATVDDADVTANSLRLVVCYDGPLARLANTLEGGDPDISVFSLGRRMEIVKDTGDAARLDRKYGVSAFTGGHGIGHTRMATESRVDVRHCHPFWARPFPDISVVHNGQVTNYHKLRRLYEMQGWHFDTENDSEIIALYIAHKLADGATLEEALYASVYELDGTFSYLIAMEQGIGYARDRFSTKPLMATETEEFVALASEEIALARITHEQDLHTWEPAAREVRVWLR
jgi:glutamate synthase domain-containing protein 1